MATYDDLFKRDSGKRYMKFENDGESFLLVQTGEPRLVPQRNRDTNEIIYIVQVEEEGKWKRMSKEDFDEDEVFGIYQPKNVLIPVTVVAKKLKDGTKDESFESFDTDWELNQDQEKKFKEALLDTGLPAERGTKYAVKRLSSSTKPYTYSVKILES